MLTYYKRISYIFHSATILAQCLDPDSWVAHRSLIVSLIGQSLQAMPTNLKIVSLIAGAKGEGGKIVSAVDAILDILTEAKLANRLSLPPGVVGIHPENRDGHGVSAQEVHALGVDIVAMGWSPSACRLHRGGHGGRHHRFHPQGEERVGGAGELHRERDQLRLALSYEPVPVLRPGGYRLAAQEPVFRRSHVERHAGRQRQRLVQGVRRWSVVDRLGSS
jgi:hypothetical protein